MDKRGGDGIRIIIKNLEKIDKAIQKNDANKLRPLLRKYQKYLKDLLHHIRNRNVHGAVCEIIEGNCKIEKAFAKSGFCLNDFNEYVKHSAIRMHTILITNDEC